jgi:hypothetical protein
MKRTSPVTTSALLASMYPLFAINETLAQYSPEEIAQITRQVRGMARPPWNDDA